MMDPDEYDADDALDRLRESISLEAVNYFKGELAGSALKQASSSIIRVREVIAEAERVRPVSSSATVLFTATAVEITLKKLILEPLIAGLIHNSSAAPLITTALVGNHALHRARELAVGLLKEAADIDLKVHIRKGATGPFLNEMKALAAKRDGIIHRGEMKDDAEAANALLLADEMMNGVFARLAWTFDLRVGPLGTIETWAGNSYGKPFVRP